jgi:hypothetical protein
MNDEKWSDQAAASAVDELLMAKLIAAENAERATNIIAQQLFILLFSNVRPEPDKNSK